MNVLGLIILIYLFSILLEACCPRTDGPTDGPTWTTIELLSQLKRFIRFYEHSLKNHKHTNVGFYQNIVLSILIKFEETINLSTFLRGDDDFLGGRELP